jgi:uncharacterized membrane protein (UPF0127 family)
VLAIASALQTSDRLALVPPPSRVAPELTVQQWRRPHVERIRAAGTHTVELQCSHMQGKTEPLVLEIEEQVVGAEDEGRWQDYTPEQLVARPPAAEPLLVRFADAVAGAEPRAVGLVLPGGGRTTYAFRTAGGVLCLVPEDRGEARALASSALAGDRLTVSGRLVTLSGGVAAVIVERAAPAGQPPRPPTVRWNVTVRWRGQQAAHFNVPGNYPLDLPCANAEGAVEIVLLRLTDVKRVALTVQGHPVDAELADTPETRSYGLQGRDGLKEGEGMLFFFPQAIRPTFIMKTVSFPLSIAFIRADGVIVHIAQLNPGDPREATPPVPVNYVLEMPQGWFAQHDAPPGSKVDIP